MVAHMEVLPVGQYQYCQQLLCIFPKVCGICSPVLVDDYLSMTILLLFVAFCV